MELTDAEKAHIVPEYIRTGTITTTQRWISRTIGENPPTSSTIICEQALFPENRNLSRRMGNRRTRIRD